MIKLHCLDDFKNNLLNGEKLMHTFICCLLFALGIALVFKGGDVFVDAASSIAKALKIPTFIIGATIVSLATTLPEMIVSVFAAAEGKTEMAVGNAVGSVTANTSLILAIAMTAMAIACSRKKFLKQMLLLIAASSVLWLACLTGALSIWGSVVLALIFILFMVQNVISAKSEISSSEESAPVDKKQIIKNVVLFIVGAAAIVWGSNLMVDNGSEIAKILGVSERIIAVTLVAVGTSLPELVTTITAIVKKESGLSIGNIIGANIIDLSLILPICSLVSGKELPVSASSIRIDLPVCLLVTLIALIPMIFRQKASKIQGFILLAVYAAYIVIVI